MPLIIPEFKLSQEEKFVIIKLRLPYVKPTKSEFSVIEKKFSFYLKPYLLQLTFNEPLKDTEQPGKAIYDPENYQLTVYMEKLNSGEEFTQLDMIGLLMNKKQKNQKKQQKGQLIQVIQGNEDLNTAQQEIAQNEKGHVFINQYLYGFNNQYNDVFHDLEEELLELAILDPKETILSDRKQLALPYLNQQFDQQVYIYDLFENEYVDQILEWEFEIQSQFNIAEINKLNKLGQKEYLIESKDLCFFGLVDIIFSYLYEYIIFQGELTSESALTINQLSSQFSAFYIQESLDLVLIDNYKRALISPMIRSFELCLKTQNSIVQILKDKVQILKILLAVQELFSKSKPREYLNLVYVDDYVIWTQTIKQEDFIVLSKQVQNIIVNKNILGLNLSVIEQQAAQIAAL